MLLKEMDPTFPSSTKKKIKNFLTVELGLIYFYKRNLFFFWQNIILRIQLSMVFMYRDFAILTMHMLKI